MFEWETLPSDVGIETLFEHFPQVGLAIAVKKLGKGLYEDPAERAIKHAQAVGPLNESFESLEKKGKCLDALALNGALYLHKKGQGHVDTLVDTVVGGIAKSLTKSPRIQKGLGVFVKNLSIF
jgi:hypothetical protein